MGRLGQTVPEAHGLETDVADDDALDVLLAGAPLAPPMGNGVGERGGRNRVGGEGATGLAAGRAADVASLGPLGGMTWAL